MQACVLWSVCCFCFWLRRWFYDGAVWDPCDCVRVLQCG